MSNLSYLTFDVDSTDPDCPLTFQVTVNDQPQGIATVVTKSISFNIELNDNALSEIYHIKLTMSGKLSKHTELDSQGNFVKDPRLLLSNFALSQIPCDFAVFKTAIYQHDCNGSAPLSDNQFSGVMGCNGTVTFSVSTPFLLWLLENT